MSFYFKSKNAFHFLIISLILGLGACDNNRNNDNVVAEPPSPPPPPVEAPRFTAASRSTTIALTSDNQRLVVVNRQKNSVSIIQVKDAQNTDNQTLIAEIGVGNEPRYVAITPDDKLALVSNTVDGTISVIDLLTATVLNNISVGTEPRGIAITPNGRYALVANHMSANVSVIELSAMQVINTVPTGGNPQVLAITNDGDSDDNDESVYVTRFFSEVIDQKLDGFDDAKQGIVDQFSISQAITGATIVSPIAIPPVASGFSADRRSFCSNTRSALQNAGEIVYFNSGPEQTGNGAAALANDTFCPDNNSVDASAEGAIAKTPQKVYANSLNAVLIRGSLLYIVNVGAQPEPPVKFNVNVQPLVSVIDITTGQATDASVNLNDQIKKETQPAEEAGSLERVFGNDVVAIDANIAGTDYLIVSRGGNYVIRANLDSNHRLTINGPDNVIRYQTGNIPSGIVMSSDASRAYTNNEVSTSVTAIDLVNHQVLTRDINASTPPSPGTQAHRNIVGKLAFYTALGIPDVLDTNNDGQFDIALRAIEPVQFRNKASDNGWSSCTSCHEDGHSDNVTWIFPTGPRQTLPLEGSFAKNNINDQRIFNWNAVRGSVTDFNNNSKGVQGGKGHATNVNGNNRTGEVFNHGPTKGISDALDAMSEWVATIRSPIMPKVGDQTALQNGTNTFANHCASCHGGAKWTKSRTNPVYTNNPTFSENPLGANFFNGILALDPRLTTGGPQIRQLQDDNAGLLTFIDNVGTRNGGNSLEIRGAGKIAGQATSGFASLGGIGFNAPSLLAVAYHGPYLHDGSALTLNDVMNVHQLPAQENSPIISSVLNSTEINDLILFLKSIDDNTATMPSDTDRFMQTLGL